jgi:hypothetical protein
VGVDLEQVPHWPAFVLDRMESGTWKAMTNTGRPKTPIFNLWLTDSKHLTEGEARDLARRMLDGIYARAHPNGCPERH